MRLLDRYLLRELLIPLGYCLAGIMLFWVAADLCAKLRSFQEKGLIAHDIAEYYLVTAPNTLVEVFPLALLLALLYALTNHARHQEITAMRAAGISLWRISLPYLALGFVASVSVFAVNELWVPTSNDAADQILARHQKPVPNAAGPNQVRNLAILTADRTWSIGLYDRPTGEMRGPLFINWRMRTPYFPDCKTTNVWLQSERAVYANGHWYFPGSVLVTDSKPQTGTSPVPLLKTNRWVAPFSETPEQIESELRITSQRQDLLDARAANVPILDILNYLRLHPEERTSALFNTMLQGRLAVPWTCLIVVLIAIPFGAPSGRRNVFVGVAASIFICFIYLFIERLLLPFGSNGKLAPWLAAWFPNLSFGLAGIWMTSRVR